MQMNELSAAEAARHIESRELTAEALAAAAKIVARDCCTRSAKCRAMNGSSAAIRASVLR